MNLAQTYTIMKIGIRLKVAAKDNWKSDLVFEKSLFEQCDAKTGKIKKIKRFQIYCEKTDRSKEQWITWSGLWEIAFWKMLLENAQNKKIQTFPNSLWKNCLMNFSNSRNNEHKSLFKGYCKGQRESLPGLWEIVFWKMRRKTRKMKKFKRFQIYYEKIDLLISLKLT